MRKKSDLSLELPAFKREGLRRCAWAGLNPARNKSSASSSAEHQYVVFNKVKSKREKVWVRFKYSNLYRSFKKIGVSGHRGSYPAA